MKKFITVLLGLCLLLCLCVGCADRSGPGGGSQEDTSFSSEGPSSQPDDGPGTQKNETVEALLKDFNNPPKSGPALVLGKPSGFKLMYNNSDPVPVPIPSSGPGLDQPNAASLRNDAVVIAYGPEDNSDTVSVISTVDRGQSWQSSSFEVKDAGKYNYFNLAFQDAEKGVLVLCERTNDNEPVYSDQDTGLIFATGDRGITWSSPVPFPTMEVFYGVTATGSGYCIAGGIGSYPVILKSGDGMSWNEITLPLDMNEYTEGYCRYAAFSGDTGLAVVTGIDADGKTTSLYFYSEDNGESWSPYKNG